MKYALLMVSILVIAASCNSETESPGENDPLTEIEVVEFVKLYDKSWETRDTTAMKELMDENYIYFTSTGNTADRATIIGWFTPADKYRVDNATRIEVRVIRIKGNTAVVSSRWMGSGVFGSEAFTDDQRCSMVIQKLNGKLKLISEHCTQIVK